MPHTNPVVLVLGSEDDEHAVHMLSVLRGRGAAAHLIDSRWFPQSLRLSMSPANPGEFILPDDVRLPWESIHGIYWRCYNGIESPPIDDAEMRHIAANDSRSLFESMLRTLPARWVNSWEAFELHQCKPAQLARAAGVARPASLRIPETIQTNDPSHVREFVARHQRCIFKPVQGGAHTRVMTEAHVSDENLASLRVAPVTIQQQIEGTDIRIFVAGERVMACRIDTPATDFRDDPHALITAFDLPEEIAGACVRIARALGLLWTGMDFKLTAGGGYYYLEANCSPMFLGFEERTGLPLSQALADVLLGA